MKYVAGMITATILGGLLSVGLDMAYKKYKRMENQKLIKKDLEDYLTIVNVKKWNIEKQCEEVVDSKFQVDIDSKQIYEDVDDSFSIDRYAYDLNRVTRMTGDSNFDIRVQSFNGNYIYFIKFRNIRGARYFLSS